MRESKFRGRRLDDSQWVEGHYYFDGQKHWILTPHETKFSHADEVDPATVGQYTGRKDKNGQEICEGDMVKGKWFERGTGHSHIGVVKYIATSFVVRGINQYACIDDDVNGNYEIIGNIHDNPELLEVGNHA